MQRVLCLALFAIACAPAGAQPALPAPEVGSTQSFVACPIYRDTDMGRKSGCWLADDALAARYDVTWAPIKPQ